MCYSCFHSPVDSNRNAVASIRWASLWLQRPTKVITSRFAFPCFHYPLRVFGLGQENGSLLSVFYLPGTFHSLKQICLKTSVLILQQRELNARNGTLTIETPSGFFTIAIICLPGPAWSCSGCFRRLRLWPRSHLKQKGHFELAALSSYCLSHSPQHSPGAE